MLRDHLQVVVVLKHALGRLVGVAEGRLQDSEDEELGEAAGGWWVTPSANSATRKVTPARNLSWIRGVLSAGGLVLDINQGSICQLYTWISGCGDIQSELSLIYGEINGMINHGYRFSPDVLRRAAAFASDISPKARHRRMRGQS